MRCENCVCKYWNYSDCLIKEKIFINDIGVCESCEGASVAQEIKNREWLEKEKIKIIENMRDVYIGK